jgi:hypothetical protein
MRYRSKEIEVADEIAEESDRLRSSAKEEMLQGAVASEILNPFVHRLELDTTYDKIKVSPRLLDPPIPPTTTANCRYPTTGNCEPSPISPVIPRSSQ